MPFTPEQARFLGTFGQTGLFMSLPIQPSRKLAKTLVFGPIFERQLGQKRLNCAILNFLCPYLPALTAVRKWCPRIHRRKSRRVLPTRPFKQVPASMNFFDHV